MNHVPPSVPEPPTQRLARRHLVAWAILGLLILGLSLWNLDGPAMWWDEGWTLSVASHWATDGLYGRLRDGLPARPGLEASFTTTIPVGLTMRLLGVGLWQGRIFGVICATAVILLLAALAARLYNHHVAIATVGVTLLMSIHPQIHPILQGRQVLAEMPMLAYLLASYLCLWWALTWRWFVVIPTALFLGIAWISKGQTAPFLMVSLGSTILVALIARRWRIAAICAASLAGAYVVVLMLPQFAYAQLMDPKLPADPVTGLLGMVAVVLTPFHRLYALRNLLIFGLPTVLALLWGLWMLWHDRILVRTATPSWYVRFALLAFSGSWLAWFLLLSVGIPRYMAPPVVISSPFVAAWLYALTEGFALDVQAKRLVDLLTLRQPSRAGLLSLLTLLLVTVAVCLTGVTCPRIFLEEDRSAQRVAAFLNALPPGTRIETYESELHFLLKQPYTFPPDQVHVALGLRSLLIDKQAPVVYDPLRNDPAYLVVGRFTRENDLYTPVLASGAFRLVQEDGRYEIYTRIPAPSGGTP